MRRFVVVLVSVGLVLSQGLYGSASLNTDPNGNSASSPLGPAYTAAAPGVNLNSNPNGFGTTFTPGVQYVNGMPVVQQQQFINGQPVTHVNGQTFINGQQVTWINGRPVTYVNGHPVPIGVPYPGVDNNSPYDPYTGYVNDTLADNPYAPAFQTTPDSHQTPLSADSQTGEKGPNVPVYGPAQNFWDKHPLDTKLVPLFRYWNPSIRDHFYTIDFGVFGSGREGWIYQGIQCYVYPSQEANTVPLYRYWNLKLLDDYYTVSANVSEETGYKLKGIAAYVSPTEVAGTVPLFRYWNQELADHYYTHNFNVMGHGRDGWVLQGIAAYVWPHPSEYVPFVNNTSPDAVPGELLTPTQYVPPVGDAHDNTTEHAIPPTTPAPEAQASTDTPLLVPLYRYWNSVYRDHFYTTLWSEVYSGGRDGWEYQGVQALVYANPQPGTVALHRYWNIRTLDHFYSTNFEALQKGGKDGWVYEGIQCYVEPTKTPSNVPLYRYYSDLYKDHFYTTRFIGNEARTWVYEGVQGYVFPSFFTDC